MVCKLSEESCSFFRGWQGGGVQWHRYRGQEDSGSDSYNLTVNSEVALDKRFNACASQFPYLFVEIRRSPPRVVVRIMR